MKLKLLFLASFISCITAMGQIGMANHYPTMHVLHLFDDADLNEDIAYAYSLRLLRTSYTGPLITLRKSSGGEQDFYAGDNDILDVAAVSSWAGTNTVFVTTVYDQSGETRNATQTDITKQPILDYSDPLMPYWAGDSTDDILLVDGNMDDLLEDDAKASVLGVMYATDDRDIAFGVEGSTPDTDGDRDTWYAHTNWPTGAFFDPGYCCGGTARSFTNTKFTWDQYTFIRRDNTAANDRRIARYNGLQVLSNNYPIAKVLLATDYPMGICAITTNNTGTNSVRHSNTRFSELIMYKVGKTNAFVREIENNQITFWNL